MSNWSRAAFFDVAAFAGELRTWRQASDIVEIGCGVGHVTTALAAAFPAARLLGIDVAPQPGRLFRGDRDRVRFRQQTIAALAAECSGRFDLAVVCDVLHHVPVAERPALLADAFTALARGGALVVKDWQASASPVHWLAFLSDRWVTGDRVRFTGPADLCRLISTVAPGAVVERELRLRPWRNNFALLVRS